MKKDVILLDGSAGTALWSMAEERGIAREPVWKYNIEHPELVTELHRRYIEAGSQMIQTNTFSVNAHSVKRSSEYTVKEVVEAAVKLAKQAAEGTDVKVYLALGPLSVLLKPYGKLSAEEAEEIYTELIDAGVGAGADYIMLETFMDIEMMKIAATVAKRCNVPVVCSMTFEKRHRTMMGNTVKQIVAALTEIGVDGVGMNCSYGPVEALEIIKEFRELTDLPLYFKPNSGMGEAYSAQRFAEEVAPALEFVSYVGACCGSDESYIAELKKLID